MSEEKTIQTQVNDFLGDDPSAEREGWDTPEVDDDIDITVPPTPEPEAEVPVEPKKEEPKVVEPKTVEPVLPTEPVGELVEPESVVAKPVVVEPAQETSELEELKKQNNLLLERINDLIAGKAEAPKGVPTPAPAVEPQTLPQPGQVIDFVGDDDIDEILSSKERFNEILSKAMLMASQSSGDTLLRALPSIVQTQVTQQTTLKSSVDAFYQENQDLQPVKRVVGSVANEVAAEHPDWNIGQIFEETAVKVRSMLGLKKVATSVAETSEVPSAKPALPGTMKGGNRTVGSGKLTEQQKQIIDIL